MTRLQAIHQTLVGGAPHSAIWNEALALGGVLREWGFHSEIFAEELHADLKRDASLFASYRPQAHDVLIYHYSTGSPLTERVLVSERPLILFYHNLTPGTLIENANPRMAAQLQRARVDLHRLREHTCLAVAHSEFSRRDLLDIGYDQSVMIPLLFSDALFAIEPDAATLARYGNARTYLLSVGRLAPNKRHEDAIKTLYFYRRINPDARLLLVGAPDNMERYVVWLRDFARSLGLSEQVVFCGSVPDAELAAYYHLARVLLCMSEHEGFCVPLVEAMRFDLPIVAHHGSAIPETLGGAGVLIRSKNFPVIAEVIDQLNTDSILRKQIVARQRRRAAELDRGIVVQQLKTHIERALESLR